LLRYHNKGVTRVTELQNRRQHWIFPFSVGVTNVQHVASLSLRFVFEKADEQCAEIKCRSCCPKTQHTHSIKKQYQIQAYSVEERNSFRAYISVLLPVSPLYYDRPHSGAAKADAS